MSGCHEPKCNNIKCNQYIYLDNLIERCQSGIEKCFEKIEHLEKVVSSLANLIANKVNASFERSINDTLKKHEIKIEKVENNTVAKSILEHDFRKIIDRIN